jgi:hypothetical protein
MAHLDRLPNSPRQPSTPHGAARSSADEAAWKPAKHEPALEGFLEVMSMLAAEAEARRRREA